MGPFGGKGGEKQPRCSLKGSAWGGEKGERQTKTHKRKCMPRTEEKVHAKRRKFGKSPKKAHSVSRNFLRRSACSIRRNVTTTGSRNCQKNSRGGIKKKKKIRGKGDRDGFELFISKVEPSGKKNADHKLRKRREEKKPQKKPGRVKIVEKSRGTRQCFMGATDSHTKCDTGEGGSVRKRVYRAGKKKKQENAHHLNNGRERAIAGEKKDSGEPHSKRDSPMGKISRPRKIGETSGAIRFLST